MILSILNTKAAEKHPMERQFLVLAVQIIKPAMIVNGLDLLVETQMIAVTASWDTMIIHITGLSVLFECLRAIMYRNNGANAWLLPLVIQFNISIKRDINFLLQLKSYFLHYYL